MSSMHTSVTEAEPFAVVRRGFDRDQVSSTLARLEAEAELLRADRDAAVERAERASREAARDSARVAELEARVDELGRAPVTGEQMSNRLSTMLSLARAEAESIRDNALMTADRIRAEAEDEAWRAREAASSELSDVRARAEAVRAEHSRALAAARSRADEITRAAQNESVRQDLLAARERERVDEDLRLATDVRRSESIREAQERQDAALAAAAAVRTDADEEARQRIQSSRDEASRLVSDAQARADEIRKVRQQILDELASIRARLEPIPGRADDEGLGTGPTPDLNSSDG